MIDFVEKVKERNSENIVEAVTAVAFLKCAEEIAQQINCLVLAANAEGEDVKPLLQMLKDGMPLIGKMEYWTIGELCAMHGRNLMDFGEALWHIVGVPGPNQKAEIARRLEDIPRQFKENLDKTGTEPLFMQCLRYCMKQSGLDKAPAAQSSENSEGSNECNNR